MATVREDPYAAFNFLVELGGIAGAPDELRGGFTEVSGLDVELPSIDYRNGNEIGSMRKLPGLAKYADITLKRGVIGDLGLWQWVLDAQRGQIQRVDGSIILLDEQRQPVMRWRFRRGWPSRYSGPSFNAQRSAVAIESLHIAHEGLVVD